MSISSILENFLSRNSDITEKDIKIIKKVSKTTKIKKTSIKKNDLNKNQSKTIRISKFLTKVLGYESKRNYDLEKIRFNKLWKEKTNLHEKPFLTSRATYGINEYKKKFKKRLNKSLDEIKPKQITEKIRGENYLNKNKKIKKTLSSEEIKQFWEKQKNWSKFVNDKKEKIKKKIFMRNENELNKYFYPKTNRNYNQTKYRHEKTFVQEYQKFELDMFKKKYIQNKHSFIFKPSINDKKYKNISTKYYQDSKNKTNNFNINKNKINGKIKLSNKKTNSKKEKNNKSRYNNNLKDKDQFIKKNKQKNVLKFLTINNNNNHKLNNDNRYYLNVNMTTSCDTFINKIVYKRHNSIIEEMILEKLENPKIEKVK